MATLVAIDQQSCPVQLGQRNTSNSVDDGRTRHGSKSELCLFETQEFCRHAHQQPLNAKQP
jgi:hypothetical protein